MKQIKKLLLLLSIFLNIQGFTQTIKTKENFINSINNTFVDSSEMPYYLWNECTWLDRKMDFKYEDIHLHISKTDLNKLIKKAAVDTLEKKWNCINLINAKCINRDSAKIIEMKKKVYYFSRPIFDDNYNYAIITMSYYCGHLCGYNCTFLLKKTNKIWSKIAETGCWQE